MIHVHVINQQVAVGDHVHHQSDAIERTDRTWTLKCTPECEERILRDVEHSANHVDGVPLTVDEIALVDAREQASQRDVSRLAAALSALAV